METEQVKLETIKHRILNEGERLIGTSSENGRYYVKFENGEAIAFDDSSRATVDNAIHQAVSGIRDSDGGKFTNIYGRRPNEESDENLL